MKPGRPTRPRFLTAAAMFATIGLVAACGDGDGRNTPAASNEESNEYSAQVASYDLSTDGPQRFIVGLQRSDSGLIVGGDVTFDFWFLGRDSSEVADNTPTAPTIEGVPARFVPVADGIAPPSDEGPRLKETHEGVGVYEATDVTFDNAGYWGVTVHATIDGRDVNLDAGFEVGVDHQVVAAGDPAPRTVNHLPGSSEAPPGAVDSRADEDGSVPDPELHQITVADAIANGRPTLVVVSTPVFCVSQFCGPITDSIQAMAAGAADAANFVHLEVWHTYEDTAMNAAAAEWIYPNENMTPNEPWVFLVDGTGTVVQRWDNVANAADVESALRALIG